ncbi:hypothetical protein F5Y04DRAFT_262783 [Hypomontagnella monticulosa]|nr:hypothetical protein F5Y04DRAFT_262783 [Hypomontagnella monticulosa]
MVGVPKSNRCDFCKWRKTKCDENWPTCGSCKKAGRVCSGPVRLTKFVHNGKHTRECQNMGDLDQDATDASPDTSNSGETARLYNVKNRTTTSGATFSKMKLRPSKPKVLIKPSATRAELLAGRIATCLTSSEGTGYSLSMFLSTLGYVPPLVDSNKALFDATDLLLSTWLKLCQGNRPPDIFDLRSYNRALRSLQKVLNDPQEQTSSATLAATIYLQATEYWFDYGNGINQISHSNGIHSIMMKRGPPKPGDNFGTQLILDSYAFMYMLVQKGKIDNFFDQPGWRKAITSFFTQFKTRTPILVEISKLLHQGSMVADTITRFRKIHKIPRHSQDPRVLKELAITLDTLSKSFHDLDQRTIKPLLENGMIHEVEDTESPFGTSYEFLSPVLALHFANVAAFNIRIRRLKQRLNSILEVEDPSLELGCLEYSARIWKTCRYSKTMRPLCAASFNSPISTSYIAAEPAGRAYLLATLREADMYRKGSNSRWTESVILSENYVLTQDDGRIS